MVMWHFKLTGMTSRRVKLSPQGQTVDLGVRLKGQISLTSSCKVNFKIVIPNFVCALTVLPGVGLGVLGGGGVNNFSVGICDGAASNVRSSSIFFSA